MSGHKKHDTHAHRSYPEVVCCPEDIPSALELEGLLVNDPLRFTSALAKAYTSLDPHFDAYLLILHDAALHEFPDSQLSAFWSSNLPSLLMEMACDPIMYQYTRRNAGFRPIHGQLLP